MLGTHAEDCLRPGGELRRFRIQPGRLNQVTLIVSPQSPLASSKDRTTSELNRPTPGPHLHTVSELQNIGPRLLVIFDGHCGFCNRSIRWFLRRDRRDRLRFIPSESPKVAALLARHQIIETENGLSSPTSGPSTILVVRNPDTPVEQVLVRSGAAIAMLRELPQPWPAVAALMSWLPRPLRDLGYRLVARYRYRIWGRFDTCPIPTAQERERFL